jgi:acyl-CoA hydrolase
MKPASASRVETTHIVLPPDTNPHLTAFGGKIMQWMDIAAGIAAGRHARGPVVTVAVDELVFDWPIRMGDVVIIRAVLNYVGKSSMEVGVEVLREDASTGAREHCLTGYFTFVAVDAAGKPVPVDALAVVTDEERARFAAAQARRARRLGTTGHAI